MTDRAPLVMNAGAVQQLQSGDSLAAAGAVKATLTDAGTASEPDVVVIDHESSGTPAANFGAALKFKGQSSTTPNRDMARIGVTWAGASDASRSARVRHYVNDSAGASLMIEMISSAGTPSIGFLGAPAIARYGSTSDLRLLLIDFGLLTSGGANPLNLNGGAITAGSLTLATALAVAQGGTGSTTASGARTNLGLAIGSDVQAYNANLAALAGLTLAAATICVNTGAGAMALDDWDRTSGTWTPILKGEGTAGTNTYGTQVGRYLRRGKLTWYSGRFQISGKSVAMVGRIQLAGFPFTSVNNANEFGVLSISDVEQVAFSGFLSGLTEVNSTVVTLAKNTTGATNVYGSLATADFGTSAGFKFNMVNEAA